MHIGVSLSQLSAPGPPGSLLRRPGGLRRVVDPNRWEGDLGPVRWRHPQPLGEEGDGRATQARQGRNCWPTNVSKTPPDRRRRVSDADAPSSQIRKLQACAQDNFSCSFLLRVTPPLLEEPWEMRNQHSFLRILRIRLFFSRNFVLFCFV